MKAGKFGGEVKQYSGQHTPFLAWKIAMVRVSGKVFPITATTGVGGSEAAAVYNLGHSGFRGAVAYVYRNIVRQVLVDNGRQGVEYTLSVDMRGFGLEKGSTMALNQRSRAHTLGNKQAAARTFAELIVNSAIGGFYAFLRSAGWQPAGKAAAPADLVEAPVKDNDISF